MQRCFQLLVCFCVCLSSAAQKDVTTTNQVWLGHTSLLRFSKHWGASSDLQLRSRENFTDGVSQTTVRLGVTYFLNDAARFTIGNAFVESVFGEKGSRVMQDGQDVFQQFTWLNKYHRISTSQSLRLEERFKHRIADNKLLDGYTFNYRLRYNILLSYALNKNPASTKTLDAVMYNEVYINFGKQIIYNTFDQYRVFAGFNYHLAKHGSLQFGYLNIFQQLASGNKYRSYNIARIFYLYNIDLRKKGPRQKPQPEAS